MTSRPRVQIFFHFLSLFPKLITPYLQSGVVGRAVKRGLIGVKVHNLRDFISDGKRADDRPYGGGPGMVLRARPIVRAVEKIGARGKDRKKTKVLIMSAGGKPFTNVWAARLAKHYRRLILVAGRYEGIDARVRRLIPGADEVSVGPYILSGGELPALAVFDAVVRQVPGALGDELSIEEKRIASREVYTRPAVITHRGKNFRVPKPLLSGDHRKIADWRTKKT
ncbi:MAG TPA: tRNA (guanosine(37)-N1)-methyltransferase TrmD [Candidatus Paceibacterota bacterium]